MKHRQSRLVTTLPCLATSFTEHGKKYGAYFTLLWTQSALEQPVHKSRSGADLWQTQNSCRQNWVVSQRNKRDRRTETRKRIWSIFNLHLCSLTSTVLMDFAHTLLLQNHSKGFEGHRQREGSLAFCFHGAQSLKFHRHLTWINRPLFERRAASPAGLLHVVWNCEDHLKN